ncbi:unnamed protein product [Penicillium salamii]|nr:unnamed protein product [Penicillium salamii]CAG8263491.1 unnamed protein product [Penicillium salamii]
MADAMDQQLLPFVKYSDQDRKPDTPHLTVTVQGDPTVDVYDEPIYEVLFTITRAADDQQTRPCILHWNPIEDNFSPSGLMLLHRGPDGPSQKEVDPEKLPTRHLIPRKVTASDPDFKELVPGTSISWKARLPAVHLEYAGPGMPYLIFWPGSEIALWDWGKLAEYDGRTLKLKSPPSDPPPPSPRAISPCSRVSGAPIFSVSISGPATLSMKDQTPSNPRYPLTVTVSYEAEAGHPHSGRPITFRSFIFEQPDDHDEGFRIYRKGNDEWTPHEWRTHQWGFIIVENTPLNVGRNDENQFWTLKPGESWSFTREVSQFPKDAASGDTYRYLFKGATLDWWDFGTFEDHEDTVVWVPGWLVTKISDPKDNGGRPVVVVPASNAVEFTLVD